ncbi:MAG TPA: GAF domain-containing protein [Anaerolineae bacterium]|nr:GAF domain-containing protein [Anaerolineae bacterium]
MVDQMGYKSLLLVPVIMRGEAIGLLGADSVDEIHEFSEREINLVRAVADQLGLAMEHQRLLEETRTLLEQAQARARRERLLREFTARLRGLTDPDAVARTAVRELGAALGRPAFIRLGDSAQ